MDPIWQRFRGVINGLAHNLFSTETFIWKRLTYGLDPNGENMVNIYEDIELKCLVGYNDFRTWPMDIVNESGSIDMQNMYVILNKQYLRDLGFLNDDGYFGFNSQNDYFVLRGIEYIDNGDTEVSQAGIDPVLFFLILKRKEYGTGEMVHG